jgi:hypothetical protein
MYKYRLQIERDFKKKLSTDSSTNRTIESKFVKLLHVIKLVALETDFMSVS